MNKKIKKLIRKEGLERQYFWFDKNGYEFGATDAYSVIKEITFDELGNISKFAYEGDGGDGSQYYHTTEYSFDKSGYLLDRVYSIMESPGLAFPKKELKKVIEHNEYDNNGNCIFHELCIDRPLELTENEVEYYNRKYDGNGHCIEEINKDGKVEYIYKGGILTKMNQYRLDNNDESKYVLSDTTIYEYNSNGQIVLETNDAKNSKHEYTYDGELLLSEHKLYYHDLYLKKPSAGKYFYEFTEGLYKYFPNDYERIFHKDKTNELAVTLQIDEITTHSQEKTVSKTTIFLVTYVNNDGELINANKNHDARKNIIKLENPECKLNLRKLFTIRKEVIKIGNEIRTVISNSDSNKVFNELIETYDDNHRLISLNYIKNGKVVFTQVAKYIDDTEYKSEFKRDMTYPEENHQSFIQEAEYW